MTPLAEWIRNQLLTYENKRVTFAQFMEWALYHPTLGYYRRAVSKVGKDGDFYTSSHVGSVFGETLAIFLNNLAQTFDANWNIVEFGSGDGKLADDILQAMPDQPSYDTLGAYYMVEASSYHRQLAVARLKNESRIRWVNGLSQEMTKDPLIVISNELVDALPVHRLRYMNGNWFEIYVSWNDEKAVFEEVTGECSSPDLTEYIQKEKPPLREGQTIEVNLAGYRWLQQLAYGIKKGYALTIDYGYEKEELWGTKRRRGTLMCYHRHRAVTTPYERVGEQDMTTHVNFSSLMRWGEELGLYTSFLLPQGEFLIQTGILQKLQEHQDPNPFSATAKRNRAIRQLIIPGGMGDTFKVLLQGKGVPPSTILKTYTSRDDMKM